MHSQHPDLWYHLTTTPAAALSAVLTTVVMYLLFLVLNRVLGQRILARFSTFDLLVVLVMGSVIARTMVGYATTLATGIIVLCTLLICEALLGTLTGRGLRSQLINNSPVLIMAGQHYIDEEMRRCRITRDDIRGALRRAGVRNRAEIAAVIFEPTGDLSVLKRGEPIDPELLIGVRSAELLAISGNSDNSSAGR